MAFEPEELEMMRKADAGDAEAQFMLGFYYQFGIFDGCPDDSKALKWYRKSAEQGNTKAQERLGDIYLRGDGIKRDFEEAYKWLWRAVQHPDCDDYGYMEYGSCLLYGFGCAKDPDKAFPYLCKAVRSQKDALTLIAECYMNGYGTPKNVKKACECYEKAISEGVVGSWNAYAYWYSEGIGVRKDLAKAFAIHKAGAEAGDVQSLYGLGLCYHKGWGTEINYREAAKWYRKAAEQGFALAQCNLGCLYETGGYGIQKNAKTAAGWFKKAHAQGEGLATCKLALMYITGNGVPKNAELGLNMLFEASSAGVPEATQAISLILEDLGLPHS
ncbi:MAG: sel1 repeat family protein [Clostridia bacterium]|nr:sel1 repeat family protein [Clostridia bacterium]